MGILTATVLLPALRNPESKFYTSGLGYPALQRKVGKPIAVQTVTVGLKSLAEGLAAPGESVALQNVEVRSLVSGLVEKVHIVEGQKVRRGDPLIEIQSASFEDAVDTARNNIAMSEAALQSLENSSSQQVSVLKDNVTSLQDRVAISQAKLEQSLSLSHEGAISQFQLYDSQDIYLTRKRDLYAAQRELARTENELVKQIDSTRLKVKNDQIVLQNALRDLQKTVIYASNDGLISKVNIHAGEIVDARSRDPLVSLTENIVFKSYVDQARLNSVKLGDPASVRFVAYPGRVFRGRVMRVNPSVETDAPRSGKVGTDRQYTYSVWVSVEDLQMPPGLQGYVQFSSENAKLIIPESAVTHLSGGEGLVMVANKGQAVVKKVKLGRISDNQREVVAGLVPGEEVVLSPRALNPGDKLEPKSVQ